MVTRWDDLCMFCPMHDFCEDTPGDICEYDAMSWSEVRQLLKSELDLLEEETK